MSIRFRSNTLKTGLAVLLAGLFFAVVCTTSENHACNGVPLPSDSAILAQHIRELKVEYAMEEFSDHSFNAHLTDKEIDSILNEDRIFVNEGTMIYAPDSSFMIAVVKTERCGSWCSPAWQTWLHFNDGSGMAIKHSGFENVTSIQKLSDGNYLVFEDTWSRTGIYGIVHKTATLLTIAGHELKYIPFPVVPSQSAYAHNDPQGSFRITQFMSEENPSLKLSYDTATQMLTYDYVHDGRWTSEDGKAIFYTGYFLYVAGAFEYRSESAKVIRE